MKIDRTGWEEMEKEINDRGKNLGGCWLPYTTGSYHPQLHQWLVSVFGIKTVVDVGCGGGEAVRSFQMLGCQAIGVEGLRYAAYRTQAPTIVHDFETGPLELANIDLIYSIEFVEHVSNVESVIKTICQGKVVCISHAIPGQEGHNHVNCQTDEYWIEHIENEGFTYFKTLTDIARPLAGSFFGFSGLIFVRNDCLNQYGLLRGDYV